MPADPQLDARWRFEDVPGITMESNRVEEVGARERVRGKLHTNLIRVSEFIQPEGEIEYKIYAPGVGTLLEYDPDGRISFAGCRS
jgi:hypothetical protein